MVNEGDEKDENFDEITEAPAEGESMESLLAQQESVQEKLSGRKVAWVKVIQVTKDAVLVDIGEKREGAVPLSEFAPVSDPKAKNPAPPHPPSIGQRIPVIMISSRGPSPTLSYRKAKAELSWDTVQKAFAEKSRVRGRVTSAIKGGFLVDLGGLSAFLPASLADLRPVRDPQRMVNTGVRCYIIELNEAKKQAVLSRKAVLEEEAGKRKSALLSELRVGEVRIGRVVHAGPAGLTVDIGGAEGFVKAADLAWGTPKAPTGQERGTKVKVRVLSLPKEGEKIALGIKQLLPNPADAMRKKYPPKTVVKTTIVEKSEAGLKLKLDNGTLAFCAAADAGDALNGKAGDPVSAVVFGINNETMELQVSISKFEDIQDRKRVAQYLKAPAPLTLGQVLSPEKESGD
jgi:small subunit ribosomal protein S1